MGLVRRMNRPILQLACLLAISTGVIAQDTVRSPGAPPETRVVGSKPAPSRTDDRRVEIEAAQHAALNDLRGQILSTPVAPGVLVHNLLDADTSINFDDLLNDAEQVGRPRWIEQDIVQVRMQLSASRVGDRLGKIAPGKLDPRVTPADLQRLQKDLSRRSYQATGQAIPVSRIASLVQQVQTPAWRDVPHASRIDAAERARASAVSTIVESGSSIRISPTETVQQTFAASDARQKLAEWASTLPATRVSLMDDRQVAVGVYVDKDGLDRQLRELIATSALAQSDRSQALEAGVRAMPTIVIGRASAGSGTTLNATEAPAPALVLRELPAWASDPLVAEGTSGFDQSKLRTARAAEKLARVQLRERLNPLKIDDVVTLSQLASRNPRVAEALDRAVSRARVYQVDYNADGSVIVRVTLDPNEVLDELTAAR